MRTRGFLILGAILVILVVVSLTVSQSPYRVRYVRSSTITGAPKSLLGLLYIWNPKDTNTAHMFRFSTTGISYQDVGKIKVIQAPDPVPPRRPPGPPSPWE